MILSDFLIRIGAAVLFGFLIGLERQLTGHTAGIRINVLVCLGTSLFVLFSVVMEAPDVTRIAAQIVTGVGFLCSGIICKEGAAVRGLNTAATIWCTAAIGVLASSGMIWFGLAATLVLLAVNVLFRPVANRIYPLEMFDESERFYKVSVICSERMEMKIRSLVLNQISGKPFTLMNLESQDMLGGDVEIEATLLCCGKRRDAAAEALIQKISLEEAVTKVGWEMK